MEVQWKVLRLDKNCAIREVCVYRIVCLERVDCMSTRSFSTLDLISFIPQQESLPENEENISANLREK